MSDAVAIPPVFAGLVISPLEEDGQYVVKDPRHDAYFRLGAQEVFLLEQLDGARTAAAVRAAFEARFGEPLPEEELDEFLVLARARGLLHPAGPAATVAGEEASGPAPSRPRQSLLAWRLRLLDPDRLLTRLEPKLWWAWTGPFMAFSAGVILLAIAVVWANRYELVRPLAQIPYWEILALIPVTLIAVTLCHEFAHGLTCKHYGGKVHEIGFLMLFFIPCLYCNVSDSWLFRERWKRIAVMLAGSYCELILWAAAVFVWRLALPGSLPYYLSWAVISVSGTRMIFNFNPLLKLDGYYILSDLVALPNLRQRGLDVLMGHLRWILWGATRPGRGPRGRLLLVFGTATWFFSLGFLALMLMGTVHSLSGPWGPVGLVIILPLVIVTARSLFQGFFAGEVTEMVRRRRTRTAIWASILGLLPLVLALGHEDWAGGPFLLRSRSQVELCAPIAGFLREIYHEQGEWVSPGALIARMEVPDLKARLEQARASVRESQAKLDQLRVGPRPEEVEEQRRRVERAEAWRDLARKHLLRKGQALQANLERLREQIAQTRAEIDYAANVLVRNRRLQGRGALSDEQYREAETKHRIAIAQEKQAQAQMSAHRTEATLEAEAELARREKELADAHATLTLLEAGSRPEEIAAERARLARLETEVRYLEGLQEKTRVTSPVGGRLTTPHLRDLVGHYYREGEPIGEVKDTSVLEAEITMSEQDAARIRLGQRVELKVRTLQFQKFHARVDRIAPIAVPFQESPDTPIPPGEVPASSVMVACHLGDPSSVLRPGMTGYAHIARGQRRIGEIVAERLLHLLRTEYWW